MHNQNRSEYKARLANPAVAAKLTEKASQWNALTRTVLSRRTGGPASPPVVPPSDAAASTLQLLEKLLTVNPDPNHLWNHRRELLLLGSDDGSAAFPVEAELSLTAACLARNPKAYGAWFHRKWSVRRWILSSGGGGEEEGTEAGTGRRSAREDLLGTELGLCASLLDRDERNFHCWNYRRFVVAAMLELPALEGGEGIPLLDGSWGGTGAPAAAGSGAFMGPQIAAGSAKAVPGTGAFPSATAATDRVVRSEFRFTSERIEKNFSNCSAFHYRSKLIDMVLDAELRDGGFTDAGETKPDCYQKRLNMARRELEIVQSAVFTEPDDQTAWWYHRFAVAWARPGGADSWSNEADAADAREAYAELIDGEIESMRELIEAEGGKCKWGLMALHMLLTEMLTQELDLDEEESEEMLAEANACLSELAALDPDRASRYKSMKR